METVIKKAIESGYTRCSIPEDGDNKDRWVKSVDEIYKYLYVCDPLFWQALGKACGWAEIIMLDMRRGHEKSEIRWLHYAKRFHEINLTEGFEKAVEYLVKLVENE